MSLKDPIRSDSPPSTGPPSPSSLPSGPGPTRPLLLPAVFADAGVWSGGAVGGGVLRVTDAQPPSAPATQQAEDPLRARPRPPMLGLHPRPGDADARSRPQAARHPQDQRAR